jgi:hypothetical protein
MYAEGRTLIDGVYLTEIKVPLELALTEAKLNVNSQEIQSAWKGVKTVFLTIKLLFESRNPTMMLSCL